MTGKTGFIWYGWPVLGLMSMAGIFAEGSSAISNTDWVLLLYGTPIYGNERNWHKIPEIVIVMEILIVIVIVTEGA